MARKVIIITVAVAVTTSICEKRWAQQVRNITLLQQEIVETANNLAALLRQTIGSTRSQMYSITLHSILIEL